MHALKCCGETSSKGGTATAQSPVAAGQRVRNTQPDGGFKGLGTSPDNGAPRRFTVGSGTGLADSSAWV